MRFAAGSLALLCAAVSCGQAPPSAPPPPDASAPATVPAPPSEPDMTAELLRRDAEIREQLDELDAALKDLARR